jgi:hypothetical protein
MLLSCATTFLRKCYWKNYIVNFLKLKNAKSIIDRNKQIPLEESQILGILSDLASSSDPLV